MPLEREHEQALEQRRVADTRRLEELRVDARLGEPRNRVELVDEYLAGAAHEHVDAGHPLAFDRGEGGERQLACALPLGGGDPRRDAELHLALLVLGLVVVPLVAGHDDLARFGGDRLAVSEHADLDLDPVDELLDEHLLVVAEGECDRRFELGGVVGFRDPDRRAEPRGLDEHRVGERVGGLLAAAQGDVAGDRDAAVAQHRLAQVLVHGERRSGHAGAHVGHAGQLEEALHGAVLAEGPVQQREDDVDLAERLGEPAVREP